jgi:hypothetical protein
MLPQLDQFGVEIFAYQPDAFGQMALLAPLRFVFVVIGEQLRQIRGNLPQKFRNAFSFRKHSCFTAVPDYDRRKMCILDEISAATK